MGRPDEARGTAVVAYAVLREGAERDATALRAFVQSELTPYKCPPRDRLPGRPAAHRDRKASAIPPADPG
ncbi:hypothetical protein GCM10020295_19100 [Streptomyces cinereospinus]